MIESTHTFSLLERIRNLSQGALKYSATTYRTDGVRATIINPDDGKEYEILIRPMSEVRPPKRQGLMRRFDDLVEP